MNAVQAYAARYAQQPEPSNVVAFPEITGAQVQDGKPTHAWISLVRLGGVNIKAEIAYRGKSVYTSAQGSRFRVDAAKFIAGENQFRDGWCIARWDMRAERTANHEQNWQT